MGLRKSMGGVPQGRGGIMRWPVSQDTCERQARRRDSGMTLCPLG
jgi:hypothetical protein